MKPAVVVEHQRAALDHAVLALAHAQPRIAVVGQVATADDAVPRTSHAQAAEVAPVDAAVLDDHALALADGHHRPLPARLAVVAELQAADHDVVDAFRREHETANAHFDREPSRLARDLDVQGLIRRIEEERVLDHVVQPASDGGQFQAFVVLVDRVGADPLQRLVVVEEHLGHPAAGLVLVAALETRVREEFVASTILQTPVKALG